MRIRYGAWTTISGTGSHDFIVSLDEDDFRLLLKNYLMETDGDVDESLRRIKQFCVSELGRVR